MSHLTGKDSISFLKDVCCLDHMIRLEHMPLDYLNLMNTVYIITINLFNFLILDFISACLIYVSNGSAIKDQNYQASDSNPSSSRTFGVKTVTRQTIHSNDGVVTRVFKQTKVQTGTSLPQQGSENQNFHNSGQDDTVHGLLPADDARPLHFGARLGSNTKRFECNVKGGCSTQVITSGGNVFGGFDHSNQESHQSGQSVQGIVHQDDSQNVHSNFEQKAVGNVQNPSPFEDQQQHQDPFVDQNSQQDQGSFSDQDQNQGPIVNQEQQEQLSFQDQQQHQDSFSDHDQQQQQQGPFSNQGQDQHQSFDSDQEQQQVEDVLGNDFDSQYEDAFRNVGQVNGVVNEPHNPIIDSKFPEQGQSQLDFDAGNVAPFEQVSDFSQQQQVNQGQTRVSSGINENFGFVKQQRQSNVQDGADEFIPAVVDQQNVADAFNQERFHQQDGGVQNFEGPNRDFGFDQGSTFRQQFVPQSHVSNENTYDYQDEGEQFYQDPIEALRYSVPGSPGEDYPILYKVPETPFQCDQQQFPAGIYGDVDAQCQVFHFCKESGGQDSFLCPNGTVFNQQYFVCDWWYNYNCSDTPSFYNLNAQLYWDFDSFEPTQIQTGSGIASAENQFDNSGEFHSQVTTNSYAGSRPDYVQQQSQFTQSNNQQVHSTSSYQQTSNSGPSRQQINFESSHQQVSNFGSSHQQVSGFRSPGEQYNLNSFVEKAQDVGRVKETVGSSFTQQRDSVQQAFDNVDGQNFDTHSEQQISDSNFNNKPAQNVPVTQTDAFSQTQTGSFDFQSDRRNGGPDGASFGQSIENVNSEDFSDKQQHNNLGSSVSSDTRRDWKPDSNSGTHYPEQNGHVQGQVDDQHQFQSNQELLKESVVKVTPNQGNSESSSSSLGGSIITQTNVFTEDTDRLDKQNQNIPQTKILQKTVEFPLESTGGSEKSGKIDSALDGHTETFPVEGFSTEIPQDVVQQQNQFDSFQDNISFRRQALLPSLTQNSVADNKGVQVFVEESQQAINQPNSFEEVLVPEVFPGVDEDSQSARDSDDSGIVKQNDVKNVFDGQRVIDVSDANQDAIDYDEVLNQFHDRNVAFVDAGNIPQTLKDTQRVIENRPAQVHRLSIQQDRNKNENDNLQSQKPNAVQQQNIQVHDIFTIMRGSPNFKQEAGQALNPQRLSFRPYGQNAALGLDYNLQEGKEIQNAVSNLAAKNEAIYQNLKQEIREQVIFPVEQPQGNKQNPWWNNAQNKENFRPTNQQGQQIKSGVQQNPDAGISQSVSVKGGPSNYNLNVPTNGHQVQLPNIENFNQPQGEDRPLSENNQNIFQQNQLQNVKGQLQTFSENNQQQFQNSQPQFHNENNQQQFQNNQQIFQNNQQQFQVNQPQQFQINQQQQFQVNQQQQFQDNQQQQFQGNQQPQFQGNQQQQFQGNQQQQFQDNQPQFHNFNDQINFNNVNNEQQFNNGPLLQNNQPQFHSANNQQPFQHINNQPQLNNIDNQQQLHNVNFEQNAGVKGIQNHSQRQNTDGQNFEENHGVKEFHGQQTFREARNDFNFPRQNPEAINANDAIVYSQNAARAAESSISYNGWKPIVKH
ncbi:chitin-binding type-2 domain-containing protein [Trichonephila inaurata madagascariensis]|uniref:Chitin-binding type-2 domain-containing protein n=1 Tax=Trichonephila inaurata madagascariensis TaxID=2747483 RepID=A0A8X6ISV6_9ARAC|nr:chitin-binding type-2 domain-containing protein [Trichonephila inaurata madagascariensis]